MELEPPQATITIVVATIFTGLLFLLVSLLMMVVVQLLGGKSCFLEAITL